MNEMIYSVGTPSSSQIYGNICAALREHMLNMFPKDFFKYTGISSELASTAMRRLFGRNSRKEIAKQERPSLMIRPRYNINTDVPFYNTPMTSNINNMEVGVDGRTMFRVLYDIDNEFTLLYKLNRDRIEFDITVSVYNQHTQIDLFKFMQNTFTWNITYALPVSLECILPKHLVFYIAKMAGLKCPGEEGYDPVMLLNYMNRISRYPITYKLRNSSGNEEFFMYYTQDLYIYLQDLQADDGQQKGMADFHYDINFSGMLEFNLPGNFLLVGTKDRQFHGGKISFVDSKGEDMVPLFTVNNLYDDYMVSIDGFKMYTTAMVKTDKHKGETDNIPINQLLQEEHMRVIQKYRLSGNVMDTIIRFRLMEDSHDKKKEDWLINWDDFTLDIKNTDPDATYRIIIYLNTLKMNEELVEIAENSKKDKNEL